MTSKPTLTVTFHQAPEDVLASGVSQDADVFRNVSFASLYEAMRYLERQYHSRYRVVLNIPGDVRRD